jgi:hypothetical protein
VQPAPAGSLLDFLSQIPDLRGRQGRRHTQAAMLAAIVCGILCGARGYSAIAQWLHQLDQKLWHAMGFWRRPPKATGLRKLLLQLPADALESAIRQWVESTLGPLDEAELQAVSIDGKSLCGTLQPHVRLIHLLSLFDQKTGCVLSQCRVDEKTNEAKAALSLLQSIILKGRVITGDAMFCQREVCQQIIDSGGHYFVVVKANQPTLQETIAAEFQAAFSPDK